MMEPKDFGKIALIVNEFGGLKHGEVQIYNSGVLVIQYQTMPQEIEPYELNNLLTVKQNEYKEELEALIKAREPDDAPSWRERNLNSYIGSLTDIAYRLNELHTFQKEKEKAALEAARKAD